MFYMLIKPPCHGDFGNQPSQSESHGLPRGARIKKAKGTLHNERASE